MTAESADDTVTYYFSTVQIEAELWLVASNEMVLFLVSVGLLDFSTVTS